MITGTVETNFMQLWDAYWSGGVSNPLSVVEQVSYLLFAKLLDLRDARAAVLESKGINDARSQRIFRKHEQHLRWSAILSLGNDAEFERDFKALFDKVKTLLRAMPSGDAFANAQLLFPSPALMRKAMGLVDTLPLDREDLKGDLFEYVLARQLNAGHNGQFRTPRHLIQFMCELVQPKAKERIGDPACGTAGFLVGAERWIRASKTSDDGWIEGLTHDPDAAEEERRFPSGDLLTRDEREHLKTKSFWGFDFDDTMLRLSSMNLYLHGVERPNIQRVDTLSTRFALEYYPEADKFFDVILANPPFTGAIEKSTVSKDLTNLTETKKTELLFVARILTMLKVGGRAAVIVPDGVLFGSSKGHVQLRKLLVERHQLDAVISLPSGAFKPYTGVATAVMVFTRGGRTDNVFFCKVEKDGYSLDDKRIRQPGTSELPDAAKTFQNRTKLDLQDRTQRKFVVPKSEIAEKGYDLSINRYRETKHEEVRFESPRVILKRLKEIELQILSGI
jgi:type I restriction enzyme M protein